MKPINAEEIVRVFNGWLEEADSLAEREAIECCIDHIQDAPAVSQQELRSKTLTIEGLGQANVISGVGLCIIIRPLGISNSYYVDEDTHTFKGNYHAMRLTLNMATDTERSAKASDEKSSTSHSVGDKVQFSGGPQYVASTATSPTNSPKAGPAKITAIAKSKNAKHPYHIIHTDKQSTVYGWVDASQIG